MLREAAIFKVQETWPRLIAAQSAVERERNDLASACRDAHEAGISDRELAELTGYSRARIQQLRCDKALV